MNVLYKMFVMAGFTVLIIGGFSISCAQEMDDKLWTEAVSLTKESITIDAHAHVMVAGMADINKFDLGIKQENSHVDFISMKEGGVDAVFLVSTLHGELERVNSVQKILGDNAIIKNQLAKYPDLASAASTTEDIECNAGSGKRSLIFSIEYPNWLKSDFTNLQTYYNNGVRMITLLHGKADPIAESETDDEGEAGLSEYGKKVVDEMNRLGMIIDVTHCSDNLQLSISNYSKAPVIASHSCMRSVVDIKRNIPDNILKEIASKGGVVCPTFYSGFVSNKYRDKIAEANKMIENERKLLEEEYGKDSEEVEIKIKQLEDKLQPEKASIEEYVEHIDHIVKVSGIDFVGIGSDFLGPKSMTLTTDASGFPLITYHLLKKGYSKDDIKKILGLNILRVMKDVEKISF